MQPDNPGANMESKVKFLFSLTALLLLAAGMAFAAGAGTYSYDDKGRLESVKYDGSQAIVFTYDENGNMVSRHVNAPPNQPDNGASSIGSNYIDLIWVGGDPNNDAVSYHILLDKNPDPTTDITPEGLSSVSFHYSSIECNTTYYWRVKAIDRYGAITWGPIWQFSTPTGPNLKNTTTNMTYTSLQAAYNDARTGETIIVQKDPITGDFTADMDKSVTIEGGFDCGFTSNSGMTTLGGAVNISAGTIIWKNFIVSY